MEFFEEDTVTVEPISYRYKYWIKVAIFVSGVLGIFGLTFPMYFLIEMIIPTTTESYNLLVSCTLYIILSVLSPLLVFLAYYGICQANMAHLLKLHYAMATFIFIGLIALLSDVVPSSSGNKDRNTVLKNAITNYHSDDTMSRKIDNIQRVLKCCGVNSTQDWNTNDHFHCDDTNPRVERCGVPVSCCIDKEKYPAPYRCGFKALINSTFNETRREDFIHGKGCKEALESFESVARICLVIGIIMLCVCECGVWWLSSIILAIYNRKFCAETNISVRYTPRSANALDEDY